MRYHLTPVKMAVVKKKYQVLARIWRKWNPPTLLVGMYTGIATMANSMEIPQKLKT